MFSERIRVTSGVNHLDRLLGGLFIGDNVVWYDDAGSLASVFCMNFVRTSKEQNKYLIYVSFDLSPKRLLEKLGTLAENRFLTILDCFTHGKGTSSDVFLKFYEKKESITQCQIIRVDEPHNVEKVIETLYNVHKSMEGDDVRLVFESLTGMQELWNEEDQVLRFYSQSCPRLYELNTIAYWMIEKRAHSNRLKAHINKIAQVAVDLSLKRGKTYLTILKADKRELDTISKPYNYWNKIQADHGYDIFFDSETRTASRIELGTKLKEIRTKRGLSQKELARFVGVTPSTISQVESNLIYPSLPALLKIAETLSVDLGSFFQESVSTRDQVLFTGSDAVEVQFPGMSKENIRIQRILPMDLESRSEPYFIEILGKKKLASHFFIHKGEEIGYLTAGRLELKIGKAAYTLRAGDVIYLTSEIPSQWKNPVSETAKLLWIKIK